MSRQKRVLSSWRSSSTGELIEGDIKIYADERDGTYDIESSQDSIGVVLGQDKSSKKYTVITRISDPSRVAEFKGFVTVGDVLVAINDRIVLDEPFDKITDLVKQLTAENKPRRLRFINAKKHSLAEYRKRSAVANTPQVDLLGFSCSAEDYLREKEHNRLSANFFKQRDQEWVEYLKAIGGAENLKPAGVFKPSNDLKLMCRRGIPVAFRCLVWQKISMSSLYRLQFPKNYYQVLLSRVGELKPRVRDDIEKDVDRTFPEHQYFEPNGHGEAGLRRVLQAFAVHNPDIGYCQSLNFVAGMMLILLPEEDAFWLLVTVVEKLLPPDYYTKSMVGTYVDQFVLAHIIKKYLPKIHSALESHQLQLPLITVQWFMCIFVNTLRPEVTLRVWDIFLNEGSKVIFRIAGALFKLHESRLLAVKDASDLFEVLRGIGKDVVDADKLIAVAYKSYHHRPFLKRIPSLPSNLGSASANPSSSSSSTAAMSSSSRPTSAGQATTKPTANPPAHTDLAYITISPRLTKSSLLGMVPSELQGLGLAHTGPADAYEKMLARISLSEKGPLTALALQAETVTRSASPPAAPPLSPGSSPLKVVPGDGRETFAKEILQAAQVVSDHLLQDESAAGEDGTEEREGGEGNAAGEVGEGPVELVDDPTFAQPELLLTHRFTESSFISNHMFSAQYAKKLHKKKASAKMRVRDGSFDFHRCDLALWRASFRPALEERYERMEAARVAWRKASMQADAPPPLSPDSCSDNTVPNSYSVDLETPHSDSSDASNLPEYGAHTLHATSSVDISAVGKELSLPSPLKISPVRLSLREGGLPSSANVLSPHAGAGGGIGLGTVSRSPSFTESLRRSSFSGARNGIVLPAAQSEADDAEITAATYRIDQEIEVEMAQPPRRD